MNHLRLNIDQVDEPQFRAMFETAAEVLGGLATAFRHYEERSERAWRGAPPDDRVEGREVRHGVTQDLRGQDQPIDKKTAQT